MNFHGPLVIKTNEATFNNLKGLSMSVVYDNNVLNPIRGQQAGAVLPRLQRWQPPPTGHIF